MDHWSPHTCTYHNIAYLPTRPRIFLHLNHAFHIHLKILRNHEFYRISEDSHQMGVNLSFTAGCHCQYHWCLSVKDREKEIETGDTTNRFMNRMRERGEPMDVIIYLLLTTGSHDSWVVYNSVRHQIIFGYIIILMSQTHIVWLYIT